MEWTFFIPVLMLYTPHMQNKLPRESDNPTELLDLVDENDTVIDTITRKEMYAQGLRNYRVVHSFVINSDGKLWIPRRTSHKKLYPNGLNYSIAGHVESGESYDVALHKEAWEEVNLDLTVTPYREIMRLNPHTHDVHCFQRVYEIESDAVPDFDPKEFSGYEWLSPTEVVTRFAAGETGKEDIPEVVKLCYLQ